MRRTAGLVGFFGLGAFVLCGAAFGCARATSNGGGGFAEPEPEPTTTPEVDEPLADAGSPDSNTPFDPDAACATSVEKPVTEVRAVDIIWMVDNSKSMKPAVAAVTEGLNAFAARIAAKNIDYRVIMLSLRNKAPSVGSGSNLLYPVCIPQPLAGDDQCHDGARFFHSSVEIKSTQVLEQFLGTMDQTQGYTPGDDRGGEPWSQHLRPNAVKSIVVVTDDDARLSPTAFHNAVADKDPWNQTWLPAGVLHPTRNGTFDDYVFHGIFGWGDENSPNVRCQYANGTRPPAAGLNYNTLVTDRHGVKAKICDDATTWNAQHGFFEKVSDAVIRTAQLSCVLPIPTPASGTVDPTKVNVRVNGTQTTNFVKVESAAACGNIAGWYYDDETNPTKVTLCPAACSTAQTAVDPQTPGQVELLLGCASVVK
jgi:hypothetical protein